MASKLCIVINEYYIFVSHQNSASVASVPADDHTWLPEAQPVTNNQIAAGATSSTFTARL